VDFQPSIRKNIKYDEPKTLTQAINKDKYLYEQGQERESLQNSWKEKKNVKSNQRRKGLKPPFNRNVPNRNRQDQYAKEDFKKEDSFGKRGRPPIQC
jgi:hypothetical protein